MAKQTDFAEINVRLPADVKDWLQNEATRNCSSQRSEIVRALRCRMDAETAREGGRLMAPAERPPPDTGTATDRARGCCGVRVFVAKHFRRHGRPQADAAPPDPW
jgi:hypothetical protein